MPMEVVTKQHVVGKSEELVGEFYEEEKGNMHKRIRKLFQRALLNPQALSIINLSLCNFGEAGAYQLSNLISHTPHVAVLKLWKCHLGPKGLEFLAEHLTKLKKLKVLALECNELGVEGVSYLGRVLGGLTTLEEVFLHDNQIGVEGGKELAKAVTGLIRMRVFTLDENELTSDGLESILSSLPLASLSTFGLAFNSIDDRGARLLIQHSPYFQSLLKLSFDGNHITPAVQSTLEAAYKRTKIY